MLASIGVIFLVINFTCLNHDRFGTHMRLSDDIIEPPSNYFLMAVRKCFDMAMKKLH